MNLSSPTNASWNCNFVKDRVRVAYEDMIKVLTYHSKRHQLISKAIVSAHHGLSNMFQIANDIVFIIITVVCLYRSPSSTEEHDIAVRSELHKLPISDIDQVILVGYFNLPDVCWSNGTVLGPIDTSDRRLLNQKKYIDCFVSCGLTWHITDDITRRRIVDRKMQESTLDQILTRDSDITMQFALGPPLRGSDHLTAILKVKLYDHVEYLC